MIQSFLKKKVAKLLIWCFFFLVIVMMMMMMMKYNFYYCKIFPVFFTCSSLHRHQGDLSVLRSTKIGEIVNARLSRATKSA